LKGLGGGLGQKRMKLLDVEHHLFDYDQEIDEVEH
jgi:hypothetical protein